MSALRKFFHIARKEAPTKNAASEKAPEAKNGNAEHRTFDAHPAQALLSATLYAEKAARLYAMMSPDAVLAAMGTGTDPIRDYLIPTFLDEKITTFYPVYYSAIIMMIDAFDKSRHSEASACQDEFNKAFIENILYSNIFSEYSLGRYAYLSIAHTAKKKYKLPVNLGKTKDPSDPSHQTSAFFPYAAFLGGLVPEKTVLLKLVLMMNNIITLSPFARDANIIVALLAREMALTGQSGISTPGTARTTISSIILATQQISDRTAWMRLTGQITHTNPNYQGHIDKRFTGDAISDLFSIITSWSDDEDPIRNLTKITIRGGRSTPGIIAGYIYAAILAPNSFPYLSNTIHPDETGKSVALQIAHVLCDPTLFHQLTLPSFPPSRSTTSPDSSDVGPCDPEPDSPSPGDDIPHSPRDISS